LTPPFADDHFNLQPQRQGYGQYNQVGVSAPRTQDNYYSTNLRQNQQSFPNTYTPSTIGTGLGVRSQLADNFSAHLSNLNTIQYQVNNGVGNQRGPGQMQQSRSTHLQSGYQSGFGKDANETQFSRNTALTYSNQDVQQAQGSL
jgi:hypothetical protein